jgi:HAD superfamily hydrolase (TIGR01509 family)
MGISASNDDPEHRFDLLIVDYGGVCIPSHSELISVGAEATVAVTPRPACVDVITNAQAAGIVVAVLSNEIDTSWADPFLHQVDHVVACADNRIFKPDRRAYQRVLMLTEIGAPRALFVDDEPDNVAGATAADLESMLFDTDHPDRCWTSISDRLGLNKN